MAVMIRKRGFANSLFEKLFNKNKSNKLKRNKRNQTTNNENLLQNNAYRS